MASDPYRIFLIVLGAAAVLAALLPAALTYRHYGSAPWFFALAIGPAVILLAFALQKIAIDHLWRRILGSSTARRLELWERGALVALMSLALALAGWLVAYFLGWEVPS